MNYVKIAVRQLTLSHTFRDFEINSQIQKCRVNQARPTTLDFDSCITNDKLGKLFRGSFVWTHSLKRPTNVQLKHERQRGER